MRYMSFIWNILGILIFNEIFKKYTVLTPLKFKTKACVSAIRLHHKKKKMKIKEMHYNISCRCNTRKICCLNFKYLYL
jgi:hypothetical protein